MVSVWLPLLSQFSPIGLFSEAPFVFSIILLCCLSTIARQTCTYRLSIADIIFALFILYGVLHLCSYPVRYADPLKLCEWVAAGMFYIFARLTKYKEKKVMLYALIASGVVQSAIALGQ